MRERLSDTMETFATSANRARSARTGDQLQVYCMLEKVNMTQKKRDLLQGQARKACEKKGSLLLAN